MSAGVIILVLILFVLVWAVRAYNLLVDLRNRFKNAFAQIDVQLKRRYDLIPNLVESVKGALSHERGTLEAVIAARGAALSASQAAASDPGSASALRQLAGAEAALGGALGRLLALAENYPNLTANQTVSQLMEELTSTENKVGFARQAFNDAVMRYNTTREQLPTSIIAGIGGFTPAELFEITSPQEREAPKVSLS